MKRTVFAALFLLVLYAALYANGGNDTIRVWTAECQQQYLADRENPMKWSFEKYEEDLMELRNSKQEPFETSVFPAGQ